jgi:hypothetical protein
MSGEKPMKAREIAMAARSLGTRVQRRPDKTFRAGTVDARDELGARAPRSRPMEAASIDRGIAIA